MTPRDILEDLQKVIEEGWIISISKESDPIITETGKNDGYKRLVMFTRRNDGPGSLQVIHHSARTVKSALAKALEEWADL